MLTAFVTRSSGGTLPVGIQAAERLGVRKGVYSFTLPLGSNVNIDGTAIYVGAATVFVANVTGTDLSLTQIVTGDLTCTRVVAKTEPGMLAEPEAAADTARSDGADSPPQT
ncbi:cation:dicarboxylate symporter family transporter [Nesterenkonia massiliensis]|uniref:cation:dicarboxylate symporter family transporter n=1 Tax=Nesterenkonia massiliensis TaxID=1232429 RepID=UPI00042219D1|nr:cation:dicarboxylase symporter family transporter [Nesterenkonia massiliensis]